MNSQTNWDNRWRGLLNIVAQWSEDPDSKYSAIIIDPITQNLRGIGFNGVPRGITFNPERHARPDKYNYFVHAEVNAIINAGGLVSGTTIYLLKPPCAQCAGAIIQSGIIRIKYL
jgi:dCMP deaminase